MSSKFLLAIALFAIALPASAICRYRDASGVHYADTAPAGVQCEGTIKSQPAAVTTPNNVAAPKTYQEADQEFKKRRLEKYEADQKAAQEKEMADRKKQACDSWRGRLALLQQGGRIMRTDAEGNREYLDDDGLAKEIEAAKKERDIACKP